jgi:hypothetical protein
MPSCRARPIVAHRQLVLAARDSRPDLDGAARRPSVEFVPDGILDERLPHLVRHAVVQRVGLDVQRHAQAILEPGPLDVHVARQEVELLAQRDLMLADRDTDRPPRRFRPAGGGARSACSRRRRGAGGRP